MSLNISKVYFGMYIDELSTLLMTLMLFLFQVEEELRSIYSIKWRNVKVGSKAGQVQYEVYGLYVKLIFC